MARARRKKSGRFAFLFLLVVLLLAVGSAWVYRGLFMPLDLPDDGYRLEVKNGHNFYRVLDHLERDGVIPDARLAKLWLRLQPDEKILHPGIWLLRPPQTTVDIIRMLLVASKTPLSRLTIVEGITFKDLRRLIAEHENLKKMEGSDQDILAAIGAEENHPEGLFAPDTYDVAGGDNELRVLTLLYQRQKKILAEEWEGRAEGLPYQSPYEALIMASIIEKETGVARERAEIAGVFVRRLQKGMRLQTDPTVIYGMGQSYEGRIRRADLQRHSAYNTYRIDGLPPTPIALPGRAAIHAALHPAGGDALYFVATGDGGHVFSATLAQHNQAVARYQKKRRANYRSSPAASAAKPDPVKE